MKNYKVLFMNKNCKKHNDLYIIEKILKTNKDKVYVKFEGYSNDSNQWVNKSDITK